MDPLGAPRRGVSPFVKSFSTVKTSLELLRQVRQTHRGKLEAPREGVELNPTCRVWIRNDTGSTLPPRSIVRLGDALNSLTDHPFGDPVFKGLTPSGSSDFFAITEDGASGGSQKLVRAVVLGMTPVDVVVSDAGHEYAVPQASVTLTMASATSGPARIIHRETGTGLKKAWVLLDRQIATTASTPTLSVANNFSPDYSITTNNVMEATGLTLSIPSAGVYLVTAQIIARGRLTGGAGVAGASRIHGQLRYNAGASVLGTSVVCASPFGTSGVVLDHYGTGTVVYPVTFTEAETVEVYAQRDAPFDSGGGQTWNASTILTTTVTLLGTQISYLKFS